MTRADHQRLKPWLAALATVLLAVLLAQLAGLGREVTWLPPQPAKADPPSATEAARPPLQAFANTWEQPLFSPGRQPDATPLGDGTPASLQGLVLTGSLVTDTLRIALLRDAGGKAITLAQGKRLSNGWTLERLEPTEAWFVFDGQQQRLRLRPQAGRP